MLRVLVLTLALSGVVCAAPAPFQRPSRTAPAPVPKHHKVILGKWVAWWYGSRWEMTFSPGGSYVGISPTGIRYEGTWTFDTKGRLSIQERTCGTEFYHAWSVVLDSCLAGTAAENPEYHSVPFWLEKRIPQEVM